MKRSTITAILILLSLPVQIMTAQGTKDASSFKIMPYIIDGNDTVYLSPIAAARVYDKKKRNKGREWRKYYRLVYNFARVYPYALVCRGVVGQVDSIIKADGLKYVRKDRYVASISKVLFHDFEKPLKNLTISQGQLLMKLIDRECGIVPYDIIKTFKNGYAASFWQGMAKLFGNDLKKRYDPDGDDAATEDLVEQWRKGRFEQTYFEIFWEYPPEVIVPEKYGKS